jgi:NAD(P)-dependent dehydrogenase (short-subunit alcohol dehydrogenase family)
MAGYLVIAGTSTIGAELVKKLKAQGHSVFITARNRKNAMPMVNQLDLGFEVLDAENFTDTLQLVQHAQDVLGHLDGIVNCSGKFVLKDAHLIDQASYAAVISANLTTAFASVHAAATVMRNGGSVVLMGAAAAEIGIAGLEAFSAAKAGIAGLARAAAATYAYRNLRFNVIAPGLAKTRATQILYEQNSSPYSQSMHALQRLGDPTDIANAILFLLNPENSWITGEVLNVDGGLSHIHPKIKSDISKSH